MLRKAIPPPWSSWCLTAAGVLAVACAIDPGRTSPEGTSEAKSYVSIGRLRVIDPVSDQVYADTCYAGTRLTGTLAEAVRLPLGREYQVDYVLSYVEDSFSTEKTENYFCQLDDDNLEPAYLLPPECTTTEDPAKHELLSYELVSPDGTPARTINNQLRFAEAGGVQRFRLLSHEAGRVKLLTDYGVCPAQITFGLLTVEAL